MSRRSRRNYSPAYRARAALAAIKGIVAGHAARCAPTQITQWKVTLRKRAAGLIEEWFPALVLPIDLNALHPADLSLSTNGGLNQRFLGAALR